MRTILILFLVMASLVFTGCYDDKGNYDYKKINEITINLSDLEALAAAGERLVFDPEITYSLGDSTGLNVTYEWTFGKKVVGTSRKLDWLIDTMGRDNLALRVTNVDNGLVAMATRTMIISSVYNPNEGFMVLSEKEGKSWLSLVVYEYKKDENGEYVKDENNDNVFYCKIIEDVYKKENGEELGSRPLFLREHIADIDYTQGHLTVFQEGGQGSVDLDGITMKKDILLVESFSGQAYPEDFHPVDAELMSWVHLIQNYDGKIYTKIKETRELFQSGYYIHTPLLFEQKEVRADMLVPMHKTQDKHYVILHSIGTDKDPENRLLVVYNYKDLRYDDINSAGKIFTMPEPVYGWPDNFVPLTDLGDNQVIDVAYMHTTSGWGDGDANYGMFLKTSEGKYLYQYFEIEEEYGTDNISYLQDGGKEGLSVWELKNVPVPLEDCVFWTLPSSSNRYVFIAYGQDIYYLSLDDPQNGIRHYYTCKSNVVKMAGQDYTGEHLMVALENGGLLFLNVYQAKNLMTDEEKFIWESGEDVNLGKIVDIITKVGTAI